MFDVVKRDEVIVSILERKYSLYIVTKAELLAIQFRKICELITFSSLIGNIEVYSSYWDDYSRTWRIKTVLDRLESKHSKYYPEPFYETKDYDLGFEVGEINPLKNNRAFLTKEKLIELYSLSSEFLHQANPHNKN